MNEVADVIRQGENLITAAEILTGRWRRFMTRIDARRLLAECREVRKKLRAAVRREQEAA